MQNNFYMTLELKFLLCINGKNFDFKTTPFRYVISASINVFLWGRGERCLYQKDGWRQNLQYKRYNSVLIS